MTDRAVYEIKISDPKKAADPNTSATQGASHTPKKFNSSGQRRNLTADEKQKYDNERADIRAVRRSSQPLYHVLDFFIHGDDHTLLEFEITNQDWAFNLAKGGISFKNGRAPAEFIERTDKSVHIRFPGEKVIFLGDDFEYTLHYFNTATGEFFDHDPIINNGSLQPKKSPPPLPDL